MFRKILLPLDGSDEAAAAIPVATALARQFGASVLLLQMVGSRGTTLGLVADAASGAMTDPNVFQAEAEAREVVAEGYVSAVADELLAEGVDATFAVGSGSDEKGIVEAAQREAVDLIVMATHARTGLGRLVHGSTTDYVIRHAHVPVLVVPPQPENGG
jgi:nucleotide-binding universal stress UspA family protein